MNAQTASLQQGKNQQPDQPAQAAADDKAQKKAPSAFRTISEVADELGVQQHVLRFWETKFSQVRPLKRGGGRRYYRPEDVELLKKIHHLLYTEGYTIKGVQKLLRDIGKNQLMQQTRVPVRTTPDAAPVQKTQAAQPVQQGGLAQKHRDVLEAVLAELKELREMVKRG